MCVLKFLGSWGMYDQLLCVWIETQKPNCMLDISIDQHLFRRKNRINLDILKHALWCVYMKKHCLMKKHGEDKIQCKSGRVISVTQGVRYQIKRHFGLFIIEAEVLLHNDQSDGKWHMRNGWVFVECVFLYTKENLSTIKYSLSETSWNTEMILSQLSLDYNPRTHTFLHLTLLPHPVSAHATSGYHVVTHTTTHTHLVTSCHENQSCHCTAQYLLTERQRSCSFLSWCWTGLLLKGVSDILWHSCIYWIWQWIKLKLNLINV